MYVSNNKQDNQYAVQVFTPLMNIEVQLVQLKLTPLSLA